MKTECKKIREDLSAFTDGMLNEKDHASVSEHLAYCSKCRQELSILQDLVKVIGRVPTEPASSDFSNRLRQRIEAESPLQRLFRRLFIPLRVKLPLELVTAAALALVIFFVIQPSDMKQKPSDLSLGINESRQKQQADATPPAPESKGMSVLAPERGTKSGGF